MDNFGSSVPLYSLIFRFCLPPAPHIQDPPELSGGKLAHVECSFYHFSGVLKLVAIAQNFRTPEKWFKEHSTWGNFQNPLFAFLRLEYLDIFGGFLKNSKSENFLLYINGVVCKVENEEVLTTSLTRVTFQRESTTRK